MVCFLSFFILGLHKLKYDSHLAFRKNLNFHFSVLKSPIYWDDSILVSIVILIGIFCTEKKRAFLSIFMFLNFVCSTLKSR